MAEYIEREALIAEYDRVHKGPAGGARKLMVDAPAADVVEVRHGRWVGKDNMRLNLPQLVEYDDWYCTECEHFFPERHISRLSNYCPTCGATMDGKGEGE